MDNEVLRALRERRSVRKFKKEQITDEQLKAVLEAGTYAPTGIGSIALGYPEIVPQHPKARKENYYRIIK